MTRAATLPHRRSGMGSRHFSSPGRWSVLRTPLLSGGRGRKTHAAHAGTSTRQLRSAAACLQSFGLAGRSLTCSHGPKGFRAKSKWRPQRAGPWQKSSRLVLGHFFRREAEKVTKSYESTNQFVRLLRSALAQAGPPYSLKAPCDVARHDSVASSCVRRPCLHHHEPRDGVQTDWCSRAPPAPNLPWPPIKSRRFLHAPAVQKARRGRRAR